MSPVDEYASPSPLAIPPSINLPGLRLPLELSPVCVDPGCRRGFSELLDEPLEAIIGYETLELERARRERHE